VHVSKPRAHFQEDACIYSYSTACFTCIGISTHSSAYKNAYTGVCKTHYTVSVYTNVFLKMNPRVRNMEKTPKY